jgi:hypothetical protein
VREIGDEAHRDRELVELVVRLEEGDGAVGARACRDLDDVDARLGAAGIACIDGRAFDPRRDVVLDPAVEERVDLVARRVAADLVAHHHLQVVREARRGEDVGELRRHARARRRGGVS